MCVLVCLYYSGELASMQWTITWGVQRMILVDKDSLGCVSFMWYVWQREEPGTKPLSYPTEYIRTETSANWRFLSSQTWHMKKSRPLISWITALSERITVFLRARFLFVFVLFWYNYLRWDICLIKLNCIFKQMVAKNWLSTEGYILYIYKSNKKCVVGSQ